MSLRSMAADVGALLRRRGKRVAVAESCSGGMLGQAITAVSGSSDYFPGGVIAYANTAKVRLLGVRPKTLDTAGAVSKACALHMARGVRRRLGADIGVAVTGVAGPGGGTARKPVGTVWVALDTAAGAVARRFRFRGGRDAVRRAACEQALDLLKRCLAGGGGPGRRATARRPRSTQKPSGR